MGSKKRPVFSKKCSEASANSIIFDFEKMIFAGTKKRSTELFICDACGSRQRLETAKRHWCDNCPSDKLVEMQPARGKWKNRAVLPARVIASLNLRDSGV